MKIYKSALALAIAFMISACLYVPCSLAQSPDVVIKELFGIPQAEPYEEPFTIKTKTYTAKTEDGWEISIERYRIEEEVYGVKPKAAVILCHGFNINNKFWDLDRRSSLARYLTKEGYDVWAPSLRGSGLSSRPFMSRVRSLVKFDLKTIPHMLAKTPFDIGKLGWTIDDHIHQDVPTIIELVKEESGFDKVYWIGHSMGGIIMYGYLETAGQDDIAGFIPIGSMMFMPRPLTPHLKRIADQKPLLTASLIINTTMASQLRNFTFGIVKNPIEELLFETENMYGEVLIRFFRSCIDDTSAGVVTQFSDSIRRGEILSSDRRFSYTGNMHRIKVPILIMGGGKDGFVDAEALKNVYDTVSSRDKDFVVISKANGYSADYGHCDLVIGKNAEQDVYPVILNWLDKRAVKRPLFKMGQ
ncbi:MAG: alpha/beta fold hydrolase [Candidatus Omnitrophica bacterium]|nr:alpha/beta fold hydrolase [Candidatus Omnitrophota bacterium]